MALLAYECGADDSLENSVNSIALVGHVSNVRQYSVAIGLEN